jgi:hypothetical protein
VRILPDAREIEGAARRSARFQNAMQWLKVYFVARFNRPFHDFATRSGRTETGQAVATGDDLSASM